MGLRNNPRRRIELRTAEGASFEALGDLARALEAYRRAFPRGPFRSASMARANIARIEQKLDDSEAAKSVP